jgi:hypothetical protein
MIQRFVWLLALAITLVSCGGGRDDATHESSVADSGSQSSTVEPEATAPAGLTRESLVLCPALEPHQDELASIVGFKRDTERALAGVGMECVIRGEYVAFIRVAVAPAFTPSITMHAGGYEGKASPAPELGSGAVFIEDGIQPHVVFAMDQLIIDVDAENIDTPYRDTTINLAARIREILSASNS